MPRVGFYFDQMKHDDSKTRCPEDVPLPSCLRACLEYLGDGVPRALPLRLRSGQALGYPIPALRAEDTAPYQTGDV
ncbi:hypothetical protein HQ576_00325 [bacterium]|nr:hypothetical protein [bacterium]